MNDTEYIYTNEKGEPVHAVIRQDGKKFYQCSYDDNGQRQDGMAGIEPTIYNLPNVRKGIAGSSTIYVVEGEKDVENLKTLGLIATTNAGGAGKWRGYFSKWLDDAIVVIIPDNDEAGRRHATDVANQLWSHAREVKIVELPKMEKKGDISDWIEAGGKKGELIDMAQNTQLWYPSCDPLKCVSLRMDQLLQLDFPEPKWVVPGVISEGCTLLAGRAKVGKTYFTLEIALSIAQGRQVFGQKPVENGKVLYLALEGTWKQFAKRLSVMLEGEAPSRNLFIYKEWPTGEAGINRIRDWVQEHSNVVLIIVDTLVGMREKASKSDVYSVDYNQIKPFTDLAEEVDVNILLNHHTNKGEWQDPFDSITGSMGIRGAVDNEAILLSSGKGGSVTLHARGRSQEQAELVFRQDPRSERFILEGDAQEIQSNDRRQLIYDVLKEKAVPVKPGELYPILVEKGYTAKDSAMRHMLGTMKRDLDCPVIGDGEKGYCIPTQKEDESGTLPSHSSQGSQDRTARPGRAI